jgi:putative membrane protein
MSTFADWNAEPWLVACLLASALAYALGTARLWRKAGTGRGIRIAQTWCFAAAWSSLALALLSPLDHAAEERFWLHMVQHELLMVVAAPLIVVSRPLEAMTWALPAAWRSGVGLGLHRPAIAAAWRIVTLPVSAWLIHALALWLWHVPVWFEAALHREGVHVLQHASFFGSALLFWWTVFRPRRGARVADGSSIASLFTTMLHTGALGALLTFSTALWYPSYRMGTTLSGMTPLEDQQLGGLVMWVPAGAVYVGVALAIALRWLQPRHQVEGGADALGKLSVGSYHLRGGQPIGRGSSRR